MDFTVIIPTYHRPEPLAACLAALAGSRYPRQLFEVVVVDDGGEVDLRPVIASFPFSGVRLLRQQRRGPGAARNTGARAARGRWLAFTDDDCLPEPDWLPSLAIKLEPDPERAVGGHTFNQLDNNPYSAASQLLIDYLYAHYNTPGGGEARFLTTNNLAVSAAAFHALGGFDETYTRAASEDREFCSHWLQRGYQLHYTPAARVRHAHHLDAAAFWRQHFQYGRGAHRYHLARTRRGQGRPSLEKLAFYLALIAYPWHCRAQGRIRLMLLLILTQLAHTAGFLNALLLERAGADAQPGEG